MQTHNNIDVIAIREETPALRVKSWPPSCLVSTARATAVENKTRGILFLNSAGASLMPAPVEDAIHRYTSYENTVGSYEAQAEHTEQLKEVYNLVGKFVNSAKPQFEIAILDSSTSAWSSAFASIKFEKDDIVLIGKNEYAANAVQILSTLKRQQQQCGSSTSSSSASVRVIPSDESGAVDPLALDELLFELGDRVRCVAIVHIPTNGGLVNDVEKIGQVVKKHNNNNNNNGKRKKNNKILYCIDACQTAGQIPINVQAWNCDILAFASRKYLRGPRGVGALYVKEEILLSENELCDPVRLDHTGATWSSKTSYKLKKDAKRFEVWENSPCLRLAFGECLKYAIFRVGVENIWPRVQFLATQLREKLSQLSFVRVCDLGKQKCGIVSFVPLDGTRCLEVKSWLRDRGCCITVSTQLVTRLDMDDRRIPQLCRASVHYFNTTEELDLFVSLLQEFWKMSNKKARRYRSKL